MFYTKLTIYDKQTVFQYSRVNWIKIKMLHLHDIISNNITILDWLLLLKYSSQVNLINDAYKISYFHHPCSNKWNETDA